MRTIVSKIKRKVDSINACLCLKIALQTLGKNQGHLEIGKLNKNSFFLLLSFRFWTFSIRAKRCFLKSERPKLRQPNDRGTFISGSTRDDGCGK